MDHVAADAAVPNRQKMSQESTGLKAEVTAPVELSKQAPGRPAMLAWIDDDLLAYTQRVWSKHLGRPVPESEAIEMLVNVKRLAEVMMKAVRQQEGAKDERGNLGASVVPRTERGLLN